MPSLPRRGNRLPARLRLALITVLAMAALPAQAVIILDSTWRQEGGTKDRAWGGFGAHLRLAAEPQFRPVLALSTDGETWGEASGTWIGNDARYAYVLTAAHIFNLPARANAYVVRSPAGEILRADRIWVHPQWNGDTETRTGFDLCVLRLTKPITDAGPPPVLYGGDDEAGKLMTFVGFGNRGIGSAGEKERFHRGSDKAAAQGMVDQWEPIINPPPRDQDGGNYLGVFLPKEDGSLPNPYGGKAKPVSPLVGLLGSGDSGGSAWMRLGETWAIVGVNSNGTGNAAYGESSWFARVSPHRRWIAGIFPGAGFTDQQPQASMPLSAAGRSDLARRREPQPRHEDGAGKAPEATGEGRNQSPADEDGPRFQARRISGGPEARRRMR